MSKKKTVKIEFDKNLLINWIVIFLLAILLITIVAKLIIPLVSGLFYSLLALGKMVSLLDNNFKFIAGAFFFVIAWKIFIALIWICDGLVKILTKEIIKVLNKHKVLNKQ